MNTTVRETVSWSELSAAIQANPNRTRRPALKQGLSIPTLVALSWLPSWSEDTTCTVPDVVSFALWSRDPMYRATTASGRRTMEMEEAQELLLTLESSWKAHNGRARGWVRKHIEEDLRGRAGGGEPVPEFWTAGHEKKRTALLIDYVCIVRGLRVAVWWPEIKSVTMFPMTGGQGDVWQINGDSGRMLINDRKFNVAPTAAGAILMSGVGITWAPPASISSTQTLAELTTALTQYGVSVPKGKADAWRLLQWQRLLASLSGATNGVYADDEAPA